MSWSNKENNVVVCFNDTSVHRTSIMAEHDSHDWRTDEPRLEAEPKFLRTRKFGEFFSDKQRLKGKNRRGGFNNTLELHSFQTTPFDQYHQLGTTFLQLQGQFPALEVKTKMSAVAL